MDKAELEHEKHYDEKYDAENALELSEEDDSPIEEVRVTISSKCSLLLSSQFLLGFPPPFLLH
jgi:hypothetical protein